MFISFKRRDQFSHHCPFEMRNETSVPMRAVVQMTVTSCLVPWAQETMDASHPLSLERREEDTSLGQLPSHQISIRCGRRIS